MDTLYVLVSDGAEWEDIVLSDNEQDAIALSLHYKKCRVEIFKKDANNQYKPTYSYYKNGEYKNGFDKSK